MSRGGNGERKHKQIVGSDEQRWEWNDKMIKKQEIEKERVKSGKNVEKKFGKTCKKRVRIAFQNQNKTNDRKTRQRK